MAASITLKSLLSICASTLILNLERNNVLPIYSTVKGLEIEEIEELRKALFRDIEKYFVFFLELYAEDHMRRILGDEFFDLLNERLNNAKQITKRLAQKGTVLDRIKVDNSLSGEMSFYPITSLLQGVEWPPNVDPTNREKYLSDDDFKQIFNMTKIEFQLLDKFKRLSLKKEKKLF